jgi:hypothetical protein
MPKATPEEVAKARELREQGESLEYIALTLGRSIDWAWKSTKDIKKGKIRYRTNTVYKNFPGFPKDPVLAARIRNLAKRGFDVPPSKQADWDALAKAGYTVEERKTTLKLE